MYIFCTKFYEYPCSNPMAGYKLPCSNPTVGFTYYTCVVLSYSYYFGECLLQFKFVFVWSVFIELFCVLYIYFNIYLYYLCYFSLCL